MKCNLCDEKNFSSSKIQTLMLAQQCDYSKKVLNYLQQCINSCYMLDPIYLGIDVIGILGNKYGDNVEKAISKIELDNYTFEGNLYYVAKTNKDSLFFGECTISSNDEPYLKFDHCPGTWINDKFYINNSDNTNSLSALSAAAEFVRADFPAFMLTRANLNLSVMEIYENIVKFNINDNSDTIQLHGLGMYTSDIGICPFFKLPLSEITGILAVDEFYMLVNIQKDITIINGANNIKTADVWNVFGYDQNQIKLLKQHIDDYIIQHKINIEANNKINVGDELFKIIFTGVTSPDTSVQNSALDNDPQIVTIIYNGNKNKRKFENNN